MIDLANTLAFFSTAFGRIVLIVIIIALTVVTDRIVRIFLNHFINKSAKIMKINPTSYALLKHLMSALIYLIGIGAAVYTIPKLRTLSVSLLAGAGIFAVVIGFASQQAFANIISGIFIAIFKPFRVGDRVQFADKFGVVEDITLRHTVIRNFENKRFVVPNSVISQETIENSNIGDDKICRYVDFGISYDSNVDKAIKIMQQEAVKHPDFLDNRDSEQKKRKKHPVTVRVMGYGDFTVNLRAWVWAKGPKAAFQLGTDLNKSIKKRFDKEGIEIPFPYRTLVFKDKKLFKKSGAKRKK